MPVTAGQVLGPDGPNELPLSGRHVQPLDPGRDLRGRSDQHRTAVGAPANDVVVARPAGDDAGLASVYREDQQLSAALPGHDAPRVG